MIVSYFKDKEQNVYQFWRIIEMRGIKVFFLFLGRALICLIFILSAIHKIFDWDETLSGVMNVISDWSSYVSNYEVAQSFFIQISPWTPVLVIIATVIEFVGGLLLLLGMKVRFGSFLLIIFLIPTTLLFHQFWFLQGMERDLQIVMFLKNIAIIGGLLYVMIFGSKLETAGKASNFEED